LSEFIDRLKAQFEAQRKAALAACRECEKPLPIHVGRGQPRLTCVECEGAKRITRQMIPARNCERCGTSFIPQRNNGRKYCSQRCQRLSEPSRQRGT